MLTVFARTSFGKSKTPELGNLTAPIETVDLSVVGRFLVWGQLGFKKAEWLVLDSGLDYAVNAFQYVRQIELSTINQNGRRNRTMEWEKADQSMASYLDELLIGYECKKKQMFSAPVYFVNDNMWTGVKGGMVFLRLSENDRALIQSENDEVRPFEPRPNFFMKEYVEIPESKLSENEFMSRWLDISYSFVMNLPPKIKKERTTKPKKG